MALKLQRADAVSVGPVEVHADATINCLQFGEQAQGPRITDRILVHASLAEHLDHGGDAEASQSDGQLDARAFRAEAREHVVIVGVQHARALSLI